MPLVVLLVRVLEEVSLGILAAAMGMELLKVMETRKTMAVSKDTGCMMASSTWAFMAQSQAPQKP